MNEREDREHQERIRRRAYQLWEQEGRPEGRADELDAVLRTAGIEQKTGDHILSDQDMLSLLEANVGIALMPESARGHAALRGVAVDGIRLRRSVSLYAVAGRSRSAAANGLMKLLRAADWTTLLPVARPAPSA